jgi:hypothetical protein
VKLTKAERAELDALREMNDVLNRPSFLMRCHWHESGYRKFARAGLVVWGDAPEGFDNRRFAGAMITDAGRKALAELEDTEKSDD